MTQRCVLCEKSRNRAWRIVKLRGKFNPTILRTQKPNFQWCTLTPELAKKLGRSLPGRIRACAKCIKATAKSKS